MGFDLYGLKPENTVKPDEPDFANDEEGSKAYFAWQDATNGAYFRNSIWSWRPLWGFISGWCDDFLTDDDIEGGMYNDGYKIGKTKAKKIASRLRRLDNEGVIERTAKRHIKDMKKLPKEDCQICKGTGTREGMEGWQSQSEWLKYHKSLKAIPEKEYKGVLLNVGWEWAHELKGCNGCKGTGRVNNFQSNYPFNAKNIRKFGIFCDNSGGFEIC